MLAFSQYFLIFLAFTIVRARAEAMQKACDLSASGLYFVHGIPIEDLREKCKAILKQRKAVKPKFDTFIDVVIDSYPKGGVVGATVDCEKDLLALATNKVCQNFYTFMSLKLVVIIEVH